MEKKDFFISYRSKDKSWAEWIAWQLEDENYSVVIQVWDFRPGSSFIDRMDKAAEEAKYTIAVLSPDYFDSPYTKIEWQAAYKKNPPGEQGSLLPVRVRPCEVKGLLGSLVYIDLVGLDENKAREELIEGVSRKRNKPIVAPPFPGKARHSLNKPTFPPTSPPIRLRNGGDTEEKTRTNRGRRHLPIPRSKTNLNIKKRTAFPLQEVREINKPEQDNQQTVSASEETWNGIVDPISLRAHRYLQGNQQHIGASLAKPISIPSRRFGHQLNEPLPWTVIIIGLISIFVLGLYSLNLLLPHQAVITLPLFNLNAPMQSTNQPPNFLPSQKLVRISQLDPAQYNSTQEFHTWAHADSSAATMTEVMNAYGHHYRITDILKVEIQLNEISPDLGLLNDNGITLTVANFGFKTLWGHNLSLPQIIDIANHGRPVIVSFPPANYPGGHSLVVTGGRGNNVNTVDSFNPNLHSLTLAQFMHLWAGFSAIVTPN